MHVAVHINAEKKCWGIANFDGGSGLTVIALDFCPRERLLLILAAKTVICRERNNTCGHLSKLLCAQIHLPAASE